GYELRVTITAATLADGSHPSSLPVWLDTSTVLATALPLGQPSSAFPLDSYLKNVTGPVQLSVAAFNPYDITLLQSLTLQLDVCQGNPAAGGTILKTLTETVTGDIVTLIVPGYGFLPPGQRASTTELMTDYANQVYLAAAEQVGLTADERPKQFVIGS